MQNVDSVPAADALQKPNSRGKLAAMLRSLPFQMVLLAIITRIALFSLAWHVGRLIPPVAEMGSPKVLNVWGNWDTWHYVTIGVNGYDRSPEGVNAAFFPVYPMLISVVESLFGSHLEMSDYRWVAVVISFGFFLAATWALSVLFQQYAPRSVATLGVVLFLLSPYSFFLNAGYTESIFIFQVTIFFLAARKQNWILAALIVAVATATRVTGVFLIPTLMFMMWRAGVSWKRMLIPVAISPLGLLLYMAWQWIELGSPFRFYTVQSHWGDFRDRTGQYIEGFVNSPLRWILDFEHAPTLLLNMGLCILWLATLWPMYRRFGPELALFNALVVVQSSFFIVSQGRMLLIAIGVYLTLAAIVEDRPHLPVLKYGLLTLFTLSLTTLGLLFANGQWIV